MGWCHPLHREGKKGKAPLCKGGLFALANWGIVLLITTPPSAALTPPLTQGRLKVEISPPCVEMLRAHFRRGKATLFYIF